MRHPWVDGRKSEATELCENGGINLLQGIIKIKEIGHKRLETIFALFSTVDTSQNCLLFFPHRHH